MSRSDEIAGRVHRAYAWGRGGQVHYRRSGPPGARSPLLLIHGAQNGGETFEAFMSDMGRERSVIAPDLPGTGMSDALKGAGDAGALADALLEVVAELGLGMVDVLAVADGGEIAVEMARQQPDVVRKLILVSAPAPVGLLSQPTVSLAAAVFSAASVRDFLDR
ncbi:MAG: alpha/beta fold hydrolase [Rhodospirillaceae bacterium]